MVESCCYVVIQPYSTQWVISDNVVNHEVFPDVLLVAKKLTLHTANFFSSDVAVIPVIYQANYDFASITWSITASVADSGTGKGSEMVDNSTTSHR